MLPPSGLSLFGLRCCFGSVLLPRHFSGRVALWVLPPHCGRPVKVSWSTKATGAITSRGTTFPSRCALRRVCVDHINVQWPMFNHRFCVIEINSSLPSWDGSAAGAIGCSTILLDIKQELEVLLHVGRYSVHCADHSP